MTRQPHVQLLACYELGHQPLSIAWPLAFLKEEGINAHGYDLSVEAFPKGALEEARFVGISVPMHTALRLGVQVAGRVRQINPSAHIAFLGHYAQLNSEYLLKPDKDRSNFSLADSVLSGEYERHLVALVKKTLADSSNGPILEKSLAAQNGQPYIEKLKFPLPDRVGLPRLSNYSRFEENGLSKLAGYTEASRGCLHTCRHCPVVPIYKGRIFVVQPEAVLADVRQQVEAGAEHITFGDPDFLNGPGHSIRIAKALNHEFPRLTFDFTTKVEHIIEKEREIRELKRVGAAFVISAFESTSDRVLSLLKKGHTRSDLEKALSILNNLDLPVQPTWVPFTPWTTMEEYLDMLRWVRSNGLIANIPPVQYSIRLLVPPNSDLLKNNETRKWFGSLKPEEFVHEWVHADRRMDQLQLSTAIIAEMAGGSYQQGFLEIEKEAYKVAGKSIPEFKQVVTPRIKPPRLTEDWFC
ncbi:MAG: CUAEP/CCAEP-tail radical SAM protein [Anaerolineae bacterium]|nr:MAG: CUAEP/CCAEP-tail radical SAM protein [Anaerolineae bacterium]